jgi:hypothetical protein
MSIDVISIIEIFSKLRVPIVTFNYLKKGILNNVISDTLDKLIFYSKFNISQMVERKNMTSIKSIIDEAEQKIDKLEYLKAHSDITDLFKKYVDTEETDMKNIIIKKMVQESIKESENLTKNINAKNDVEEVKPLLIDYEYYESVGKTVGMINIVLIVSIIVNNIIKFINISPSFLSNYILIFLFVVINVHQLILKYRIKNGFYGTNKYELRELLNFIEKNNDKFDNNRPKMFYKEWNEICENIEIEIQKIGDGIVYE